MNKSENIQKKTAVKKHYQQPELAAYGSLTRLTEQHGPGTASDRGSNKMAGPTPISG